MSADGKKQASTGKNVVLAALVTGVCTVVAAWIGNLPRDSAATTPPSLVDGPSDTRPAQTEPVNFTGTWVSPDGQRYSITHVDDRVSFAGTDQFGADVTGNGAVNGRVLQITYVRIDQRSRSTGTVTLTVSENGREAIGTYWNETFRERNTMVLRRR